MKYKLHFLLAFMCILFMQQVKSQSTCSSAQNIQLDTNYGIFVDTVYWVSFTATDSILPLSIGPSELDSLTLTLYSGSCSNLTVIEEKPKKAYIEFNNLVPNNTYFLRFSGVQDSVLYTTKIQVARLVGSNTNNTAQSTSAPGYMGPDCDGNFQFKYFYNGNNLTDPTYEPALTKFKFYLDGDLSNGTVIPRSAFTSSPYPVYVPQNLSSGSHYVQVARYNDDINSYIISNLPKIYFEVHPPPVLEFNISPQRICKEDNIEIILNQPTSDQNSTYTVWIPNFPSMGVPLIKYDFDDFQTSPKPTIMPLYYVNPAAGNYGITIEAENGCGTISQTKYFDAGLLIDFEAVDLCEGNETEFIASDACDPQYYPQNSEVIWEWEFGDGSIATSSTNSILHTYTNAGTYNVILTATLKNTITGDVITTNTISKTIYVDERPDDIVIDGHMNDCDNHEKDYTIENYNSNYIYHITIDPPNCGSVTYNGVDNYTVAWNFYSHHYADMIVHASNSANPSCDRTTVYRVVECCDEPDEPVHLNNIDSYSQLPQNIKTIFTSLSEDVIINGTLVIDEDVTISASYDHLFFGGNAKILVKPGYELEMDKVILKQACEYMWDGIYLPDISSKVSITDCEIYDAQNAVVSKSGGEYYIESTSIENCYKGVVVKDYTPILNYPNPTPPHPGIIINTSVTGKDDLLYLPYKNKQSRFGMDISKVNDLTIGDITDPNNRNTFSDLFCGIRARNSYIKVHNNKFKNIHSTSNLPLFQLTKPGELGVPTAVFSASTINPYSTLPFLVEVKGDKANGTHNIFDGFYRGIHVYNLASDIQENEFLDGADGIYIRKPRSQTRVKYNDIGTVNDYISRYGILAFSTQSINVDLSISNNEIYTKNMGIRMRNLNSFSNSYISLVTRANSNSIYFEGSNYNDFKYGFRIQNCDRANFKWNAVERLANNAPPATDDPNEFVNMYGFSVESSNLSYFFSNSLIKYMGGGFRIAGNCNHTKFYCNEIQESNFGFVFDHNASLTDVGSDQTPSDNRWFSTDPDYYWHNEDCRKMDVKPDGGTINFAFGFQNQKWYIEDGAMNTGNTKDPEISDVNHAMNNPLSLTESDPLAISPCGPAVFDPDDLNALRDEYFALMADQGYNYDSLEAQYNFYDAQFVYEVLREDPMLIDLGTVNDEYFQTFYDSVQQTVVGDIEDIEDLMEDDDLDSAILVNEQLDISEDWNYYLQQVNRVYLNKYARGYYDWITDAELDMLEDIALTTPQEGGDAVYIARTMLGIDADDYEDLYYDITEEASYDDETKDVMVYPNPADNKISVRINTDPGEHDILVSMYNINGKLVYNKNYGADTYFTINTEALKNGLYFVKVTNHHTVDESTKIMIHH